MLAVPRASPLVVNGVAWRNQPAAARAPHPGMEARTSRRARVRRWSQGTLSLRCGASPRRSAQCSRSSAAHRRPAAPSGHVRPTECQRSRGPRGDRAGGRPSGESRPGEPLVGRRHRRTTQTSRKRLRAACEREGECDRPRESRSPARAKQVRAPQPPVGPPHVERREDWATSRFRGSGCVSGMR